MTNSVAAALAASPDRATRAAHDPLNHELAKPTDSVKDRAADHFADIRTKLLSDHKAAQQDLDHHLTRLSMLAVHSPEEKVVVHHKRKTIAARASVLHNIYNNRNPHPFIKRMNTLADARAADAAKRAERLTVQGRPTLPSPIPEHVEIDVVAEAYEELVSDAQV